MKRPGIGWWYIWCAFLGGAIGAAGINIINNPFWFIAVDFAFIMASLYAVRIIWPKK